MRPTNGPLWCDDVPRMRGVALIASGLARLVSATERRSRGDYQKPHAQRGESDTRGSVCIVSAEVPGPPCGGPTGVCVMRPRGKPRGY